MAILDGFEICLFADSQKVSDRFKTWPIWDNELGLNWKESERDSDAQNTMNQAVEQLINVSFPTPLGLTERLISRDKILSLNCYTPVMKPLDGFLALLASKDTPTIDLPFPEHDSLDTRLVILVKMTTTIKRVSQLFIHTYIYIYILLFYFNSVLNLNIYQEIINCLYSLVYLNKSSAPARLAAATHATLNLALTYIRYR